MSVCVGQFVPSLPVRVSVVDYAFAFAERAMLLTVTQQIVFVIVETDQSFSRSASDESCFIFSACLCFATNTHELDFNRKQLVVFCCDVAGAMNDTSTFLIDSRESFSVADPQGVLVDDGLVKSLQGADGIEAQMTALAVPQRVHFRSLYAC